MEGCSCGLGRVNSSEAVAGRCHSRRPVTHSQSFTRNDSWSQVSGVSQGKGEPGRGD